MRDAIVLSGWTWEALNVPERMALALAHSGSRVLYCENPVSFFRNPGRPLTEVDQGIFAFRPKFLGNRLNLLPILSRIQARILANQMVRYAAKLKLKSPVFVYPHGNCLALCREFRRRGFPLVHICMDCPVSDQIEHVDLSDITLAIPQAAFEELNKHFGNKVRLLPQFGSLRGSESISNGRLPESFDLSKIPRPRLGYLGNVEGRLSLPLLRELLTHHPEWQFLFFGTMKCLALRNAHALSWRSQRDLKKILNGLDIGFMPYDCSNAKNLNCAPLKLFDYFAHGIPVVSSPILYVRQYRDLVYIGGTAEELTCAISSALAEPADSPKRARRKAVAREHSIENQARILARLLDN